MADGFSANLPTGLRFEPTPKRVRAELAGGTLADSLVGRPRMGCWVRLFGRVRLRGCIRWIRSPS